MEMEIEMEMEMGPLASRSKKKKKKKKEKEKKEKEKEKKEDEEKANELVNPLFSWITQQGSTDGSERDDVANLEEGSLHPSTVHSRDADDNKVTWTRLHRMTLFVVWLVLCTAALVAFRDAFEVFGGNGHPYRVLLVVGFACGPVLAFSRFFIKTWLLYLTFTIIVVTQGETPTAQISNTENYGLCFPIAQSGLQICENLTALDAFVAINPRLDLSRKKLESAMKIALELGSGPNMFSGWAATKNFSDLIQMACQSGILLRCDSSCVPDTCGLQPSNRVWTPEEHETLVGNLGFFDDLVTLLNFIYYDLPHLQPSDDGCEFSTESKDGACVHRKRGKSFSSSSLLVKDRIVRKVAETVTLVLLTIAMGYPTEEASASQPNFARIGGAVVVTISVILLTLGLHVDHRTYWYAAYACITVFCWSTVCMTLAFAPPEAESTPLTEKLISYIPARPRIIVPMEFFEIAFQHLSFLMPHITTSNIIKGFHDVEKRRMPIQLRRIREVTVAGAILSMILIGHVGLGYTSSETICRMEVGDITSCMYPKTYWEYGFFNGTGCGFANVRRINCGDIGNVTGSDVYSGMVNLVNITISGENVKSVPWEWSLLPNAQSINISATHVCVLPWILSPQLKHLNIPACAREANWSSRGLASIKPYKNLFGALTNIRSIDLSFNELASSLPRELFGNYALENLESIDLSFNNISKIQWTHYTFDFSGRFIFYENPPEKVKLKGKIPESLLQMTQLQILPLSKNDLHSKLPAAIGQLTQLQWLDLSGNSLSGTISTKALGQLARLNRLDLSDNKFSGTIPTKALGQLTCLNRLDLSGNKFSGTIPLVLGNLTQLQWLDLSGNSFSGTLPTALGQLTRLNRLDLSGNSFTGTLPTTLGRLT
eukprot:g4341.t1